MGNMSSGTRVKEFKLFKALPESCQIEIFNHLNIQEQSNLARADHFCYQLFSNHIYAQKLIMLVAHGDEAGASSLLDLFPNLSLKPGDVTDYSGRTFKNITAYEYAYWARDWHMCDMLASHMNAEQKIQMLKRVNAIEQHGLTYTQLGVTKNSKHFSLEPLKDAYTNYLLVYERCWAATPQTATYADLSHAWLAIGVLQRDLPAYVVQEYCRPDRPFHPRPEFSELNLPRTFDFYNYYVEQASHLFPLSAAPNCRLGSDFTLMRASPAPGRARCTGRADGEHSEPCTSRCSRDLSAVIRLDEISNARLTQMRDNLQQLGVTRAASV